MSEPYFIWKGIDSRAMRVWVQKHPPIDRPPMRYQSVTIPGRPGSLTLVEGADIYEPYVREMTIMPKPNADIHAIVRWLTGSSYVVFGHEENRIQKARIYDEISLVRQFADQRSAVVRFLCDPFKGERYGDREYAMTVDAEAEGTYQLEGEGDVICYPKFELTASGSVSIIVNGTELALSGLDDDADVTIDCETRTAYTITVDEGTGVSDMVSVTTYGDYAKISPTGQTEIAWTEGFTALKIIPRWRWF